MEPGGIQRLANIATAASTVVAACMLVVGSCQLRQVKEQIRLAKEDINDTHEWNRRRMTAEILKSWNNDLKANVKNIRLRYLDNFHNGVAITDAEKIYKFKDQSNDEKDTYKGVYEEIVWMLNYFEYIAQCYRNGLLTTEIVDHSQKDFMQRSHDVLLPFIDYYRKNSKAKKAWKPFTDLIHEWNEPPDNGLEPIGTPEHE